MIENNEDQQQSSSCEVLEGEEILEEEENSNRQQERKQEQKYRFGWILLGEAEFFLPDPHPSFYCAFSRATLKDHDLLRASERKPNNDSSSNSNTQFLNNKKTVDDFNEDNFCDVFSEKTHLTTTSDSTQAISQHTISQISSASPASIGTNLDSACMDSEQQQQQEEEPPIEMAAMRLPMEFANVKSEIVKKKRKRKNRHQRNNGKSNEWQISLTFQNYWDMVGQYIIQKTWLNDWGSQMDEQVREEFERKIMECWPEDLLECHRNLEDYSNIVYSKDADQKFETWEELYERHCELVKERVNEDFERFQKESALNRCKEFLKTVTSLNFVPGCEIISEPDESSAECSKANVATEETAMKTSCGNVKSDEPQTNKRKNSLRRSLVSYDDMEMFDDIYADFYADDRQVRSLVLNTTDGMSYNGNSSHTPPHRQSVERFSGENERREQKEREKDEEGEEEEHQLTMDEKLNFDFGFDEERDAHLIAKNCFKVFAKDSRIKKYLNQRFRLFSRINKGVCLDRDGWFSVTPERVAQHMADRIVRHCDALIVDAFCGVGGNAIQFALKGAFVIAIDLDPVRLRCAAQNARVYGVEDRINFICVDFFHFAKSPSLWIPHARDTNTNNVTNELSKNNKIEQQGAAPIDAVFLSPPWGGPSYLKMKEFDLNTHLTPNGFDIFRAAKQLSSNIAYFLPRQTTVSQLVSLAGPGGSCEIEQNMLNTKIKALTAYYGDLITGR